MAITDLKLNTYAKDVSALSDTPNDDGLDSAQVKAVFMGAVKEEIKTNFNALIDALGATTDGNSGADNIGATAIKENGATTVQGQLEELQADKVGKITGKGLSTNDFTNVDVEALANKVDKIDGKGLSEADFTNTEKTKLEGIAENANNYSLPTASATVLGGIKIGQGMEMQADGSVNATAAPAPDLPCREQLAQEVTDRAAADAILRDRIATEEQARATEEQTRATADNNLQAQITTNKNAANVDISETVRTLYGLTTDNANVDKVLEKNIKGGLLSALLTGFSKTADTGSIVATDTLAKALSRLSNSKLTSVSGTYTGNGQSLRTITVGLTPKIVILSGVDRNGLFSIFTDSIIFMYGKYPSMYTANGAALVNHMITNGFTVTSNFEVADNAYFSTNKSDIVYNYIAIG